MNAEEKLTLVGFFAVLLGGLGVLFMLLCFRVVGVGEVGIITSFGKVTDTVHSGVVIKAPWPFQQLDKFDIKTQKDSAEAAAASADLQDVKVTLVTNFHLDEQKIGELYRTVGTDYKARIIDPAIQESVKATTSKYNVADMIAKRPELKEVALKALRDRLAPRGITIEDISIVNLGFSREFTEAIERKQVAQQDAEKAAYLVQKAENEARARVADAQGQAEAQRLLQQSLTNELLQKLAIEKWNGVLPTVTSGATPFINVGK